MAQTPKRDLETSRARAMHNRRLPAPGDVMPRSTRVALPKKLEDLRALARRIDAAPSYAHYLVEREQEQLNRKRMSWRLKPSEREYLERESAAVQRFIWTHGRRPHLDEYIHDVIKTGLISGPTNGEGE